MVGVVRMAGSLVLTGSSIKLLPRQCFPGRTQVSKDHAA